MVKWQSATTASFEIIKFAKDSGAGGQTRTDDLLITNQLLYQLSYAGTAGIGGQSKGRACDVSS